MKKILAVVNQWHLADKVLLKARKIASALGGEVFVLCPVSSEMEEMNRYVGFDNFDDIKRSFLAGAETRLEPMLEPGELDYEVAWFSHTYQGVAQKAEELSAEMIVMGVDQHSVIGDFLHKKNDWHLLRDASCPVLILNEEYKPYQRVTVAVDALDESEDHSLLISRVIDEAVMMSEALNLPLEILTVIPDSTYIYTDFTGMNVGVIEEFGRYAVEQAKQKQHQILSRLGLKTEQKRVVRGGVEVELQNALSESGLLVMGTIANKGLKGIFVGNTAERLLSHLNGDLLVVN